MASRDEEVRLLGITPKEHLIRYSVNTGRSRYPFKAMIKGDYILAHSQAQALAIRYALKSFYRRNAGRRFTVRMKADDDNVWVCRRVE